MKKLLTILALAGMIASSALFGSPSSDQPVQVQPDQGEQDSGKVVTPFRHDGTGGGM